jgi:tRNA dimethylallyltransferase
MKRKIIIITGATATGKTNLSIELAKIHNGSIVNFDSLLFYKELEIGTARPTLEEMSGVEHFLVGTDSISTPINAKQFAERAFQIIEQSPKNQPIFLVGGSGFYLQALLYGMYEDLSTPQSIKDKSDQLYNQKGIEPFIEILKTHDQENFKRLHSNDHYRIRRAVEYFWTTNKPFSEAKKNHEESLEKSRSVIHKNWDCLFIYLDIPKDEHYEIIKKRTKKMFDLGLIDEVQNILNQGFSGKEKPLESIGYKEVQLFLKGEITLEACEELIFISTRQLAKSQRTWFKGQKMTPVHPLKNREIILDKVLHFLAN